MRDIHTQSKHGVKDFRNLDRKSYENSDLNLSGMTHARCLSQPQKLTKQLIDTHAKVHNNVHCRAIRRFLSKHKPTRRIIKQYFHSKLIIKHWLKRLFPPIKRAKDAIRYVVYAVVILSVSLSPLIVYVHGSGPKTLSYQAGLLLNKPDMKLFNGTRLDLAKNDYVVNESGLGAVSRLPQNVLVGQPGTGIYSARIPVDLSKGISITDDINNLSFGLTPDFTTSTVNKTSSGHFVYNLGNGAVQAVYTPQKTQLAEDIVVNHNVGNVLEFPYTLNLPKGFKAFSIAGGSIGIEGAGNVDFSLTAPVIKQSNAQTIKSSTTKLILKKNKVYLLAVGLKQLSYPISIDPSITINTQTNFNAGNNEGDINATNSQFSEGQATGGALDPCGANWAQGIPGWCYSGNATTSLPAATEYATSVVYNGYVYEIGGWNGSAGVTTVDYAPIYADGALGTWTATTSLPAATDGATSVVYNGYVYEIGGYTTAALATVDYAPINSNGTLGTWTATTSLPAANDSATSVVYNGYVYQIGGGNGSAYLATVDYAPINSNGTLGTWTATTSLLAATEYATSVVYNGYVYEIGGWNGSVVVTTVDYAPINANGTLGTWTATTSLPATTEYATSVVYNGYVYEIGGYTTAALATVDYAPINANGTLGTWTATTSLPAATDSATSVVYNGYVYEIGGVTTVVVATVDYAPINANGALGTWTATNSLPATTEDATSVVYNGYVYEIGGYNGSAYLATVDYAPINSNGTLGAWTATTSLPATTIFATSVVYNGYVYEIGGWNGSAGVTTVDYAPINSNGTIGAWTATNSLPATTEDATSVVYNGYVYEIGGDNGTAAVATVVLVSIFPAGYIGNPTGSGQNGWGSTTGLPATKSKGQSYYPYDATSVVYNGYVYEIGGVDSGATATVDYAPINANGTLGAWTATTSLLAATQDATSVVYNGYVYEIGGYNGTAAVATVDYAPINSNGTLGAWTATTSLLAATQQATSVVYSGYVYEIGGYNGTAAVATVDYAPINSNGTLGAWTATTSLLAVTEYATSVVYNGYVYEIGGDNGSATLATVDYAPINANGTLGTWTATTSLPDANYQATSVVYNGYIYEIGGWRYTTALSATVDYAPINANGTLGTWTATTSLPSATYAATSVVYNGYVYEIGGWNGSAGVTNVDYGFINNGGPGTTGSYTTTTSLPGAAYDVTSVIYNGYVYEIGGYTGSANLAFVDYAPINSNGTLGAWTAATSLPTATNDATSVAYNGYVYEIGGNTSSGIVSTVDYAPINSDGTLGSWTATTSLPVTTDLATSVAYNGYVYEIGGYNGSAITATVDYAPINANGTLGSWTATTSLPVTTDLATSVAYNGYVYEIGGYNGSAITATIDYAPINSDGTLGSWTATTSLSVGTDQATSVAYNGYVYEIGGATATVDYAPINSDGTLGSWTATTSLPAAISSATSVVYNGYVYEIGGYTSAPVATIDYAPLNVIPRIGYYSMLVNVGYGVDVTPVSILVNGSNTGNPGIGGLAGVGSGGMQITYSNASTTCTTLSPEKYVNLIDNELTNPFAMPLTNDGCGNTTAVGDDVFVRFTLDDSQTATFPDINGNHTTITGFNIFYHPASSMRLRGGATFSNGSLQSLDAPPTPVQ